METKNEYSSLLSIMEGHEGACIPAMEYYFVTILNSIYKEDPRNYLLEYPKDHSALELDDFFYLLSRSPLLILLRKNLECLSEKSELRVKLVRLIKAYFADSVLNKFNQYQSRYNMKYTSGRRNFQASLKINSVLAIYLGISFERQVFTDFEDFFAIAVD